MVALALVDMERVTGDCYGKYGKMGLGKQAKKVSGKHMGSKEMEEKRWLYNYTESFKHHIQKVCSLWRCSMALVFHMATGSLLLTGSTLSV